MYSITAVDFLLFCFASVGMTLIIVEGTVFRPLRDAVLHCAERVQKRREKKGLPPGFSFAEFFYSLISCVQCTGFWCGLFCGLFLLTSDSSRLAADALQTPLSVLIFSFNRIIMLFCCGTAGSFLSMLGHFALNWLFFSKLYFEQKSALETGHSHEHEETEAE